jgi:hypothetical protein
MTDLNLPVTPSTSVAPATPVTTDESSSLCAPEGLPQPVTTRPEPGQLTFRAPRRATSPT